MLNQVLYTYRETFHYSPHTGPQTVRAASKDVFHRHCFTGINMPANCLLNPPFPQTRCWEPSDNRCLLRNRYAARIFHAIPADTIVIDLLV